MAARRPIPSWSRFSRTTPAVFVLTVWMAPFLLVSMLLGRVVSRQREFAADRAAVALTGSAATLSATLLRLNGSLERRRRRDLRGWRPWTRSSATCSTDAPGRGPARRALARTLAGARVGVGRWVP